MLVLGIVMTARWIDRHNNMYNPLTAWIERTHQIPRRFYTPGHEDVHSTNWGAWLSIEDVHPYHLAANIKWNGLLDSARRTDQYLQDAAEFIDGLEGGWLDREEREIILENCGIPPAPCLPIYLISVSTGTDEKLVYVGKTVTDNRFIGGHATATKLHHPKYSGIEKKIYRAAMWFYIDDEYVALEWIKPEALAAELLDGIESSLIFNFQPELNISKKNTRCATKSFDVIHIQNLNYGPFLNDKFVFP